MSDPTVGGWRPVGAQGPTAQNVDPSEKDKFNSELKVLFDPHKHPGSPAGAADPLDTVDTLRNAIKRATEG